ncbi:MAG: hypothetical protein IJ688_06310 [Treponema sp.]|nr:hypothetical protein [Treponema sp.]
MRKSLFIFRFFLITGLAFASGTKASNSVRTAFPKDGIYSYDFERYVECIETVAMYQAYGMEAYQDILRKRIRLRGSFSPRLRGRFRLRIESPQS